MNEIIKAIKNRRSVRSYKEKEVEKEKIDLILECAQWAPSSHNSQSWHFTVIKNKGLRSELNEETKKILLKSDVEVLRKLGKREDLFYKSPTIIVVSGLSHLPTSIIDCSAATQNLILAAESVGLATCWNGLVSRLFVSDPENNAIKNLKIPEGYTPFYAVSVGYAAHDNKPPKRKGENVQFLD